MFLHGNILVFHCPRQPWGWLRHSTLEIQAWLCDIFRQTWQQQIAQCARLCLQLSVCYSGVKMWAMGGQEHFLSTLTSDITQPEGGGQYWNELISREDYNQLVQNSHPRCKKKNGCGLDRPLLEEGICLLWNHTLTCEACLLSTRCPPWLQRDVWKWHLHSVRHVLVCSSVHWMGPLIGKWSGRRSWTIRPTISRSVKPKGEQQHDRHTRRRRRRRQNLQIWEGPGG